MQRRTFLGTGVALAATTLANNATANLLGGAASSALANEFRTYDAVGLAQLVKSKQVKPEELLEAAIARCEAVNPKINAVIMKHYDEARAAIRKGLPDGPLRGVPFLVADEVGLANTETTFGLRLFAYRSPVDSELVERYRHAGLVIFGKTATPGGVAANTESLLYGVTRNPWNLGKAVGASSGGSCAAVAAGIAPAAQGGDGGGSLRAPSAFCGVVGLKPSRGMTPGNPFATSLDVDHAATRTIRDCATLLDVVAGAGSGGMFKAPIAKQPYIREVGAPVGKLKIGVMTDYAGYNTHAECIAAVRAAGRLCETLGHVVEEVKPPIDYQQLRESFINIFTTIITLLLRSKEQELGRALTLDEIGVANALTLEQGRKLDAASHLQAEMMIATVTTQMDAFFNSYDVLLTPTVGTPPVDIEAVTPRKPPDGVTKIVDTYGTFTVAGSYAGIPGISMPLYWTKDGLPVGTLFQARFGNDALLLRLASQLEQASPWVQRYPKL